MDTSQSFLDRVDQINIYRRGNERAPHKPLYLLQCIAAMQQGRPRLQAFTEIEPLLREALIRYGLNTTPVSPQYPFWRLQNDGLAEVVPNGPYQLRGQSKDPTKGSLIEMNAHGGLCSEDHDTLRENLNLQTLAIHRILDAHFPRSIHEDLIDFFGLRLSGARESDQNTESEFRDRVIQAYDHRCALTGFSLGYRLGFPGLEAAHICWPQSGGNDEVSNGIAMTSLFRKLFHLGLFTIDGNLLIRFSKHLTEQSSPGESVLKLEGREISRPKDTQYWPNEMFLDWHQKWVFRC